MVVRGTVSTDKLQIMYNTINNIIQNQNCYYKDEEVKIIKKDEKNIFLKKQ